MRWLGLFALAVLAAGCGLFQPVEVTEFVGFTDLRLNDGKLQGALELRVYNPNPYTLHAISSEVDVFVDDELWGHCTLAEPVRIPRDASSDVVLAIETDKKALEGLVKSGLKSLFGGASIVRASGTVRAQQWWMRSDIPVQYTDTLRLR